jgi:hypothetical protein
MYHVNEKNNVTTHWGQYHKHIKEDIGILTTKNLYSV